MLDGRYDVLGVCPVGWQQGIGAKGTKTSEALKVMVVGLPIMFGPIIFR
jgi:outer membrane receptor for Fe3+-dicitrate